MNTRQRRALSTGLIVYGIVGIILAIAGAVGALALNARADDLAARAQARLETAGQTLDSAATAIDRTSAALSSLSITLTVTSSALTTIAPELAKLSPTLEDLEQQANEFSILGQKPLASLGPLFGQLGEIVDVLSQQLVTVASAVKGNSDTLLATIPALDELSSWLRQFTRELTDGSIEDAIVGSFRIVTLILLVLAVWFAVPAIGALALGAWLRRQHGPAEAAA